MQHADEIAADIHAAVEREGDVAPGAPQAAASPEVDPRSGDVTALERGDRAFLKVPVPRTACASSATRPDESLTVFTSEDLKFSSAVLADTDGAFRALVHVDSPEAPSAYRFEVTLPEGGELLPLEDGGAVVRNARGDLLASFTPPWATDANGVAVPTHYEIDGTTLIQHLELSAGTAYPVVADPFWIPALWLTGHLTRHALTQMARRKVSEAVVKQVVQNGVRRAGNRGTSVFTQGKGANRIRVVVDNRTGNIITVTKG